MCGIVTVIASGADGIDIGGSKWVVIATLPSGYRPAFDIPSMLNGAGSDLGGLSAVVSSNGEISAYCNASSARYWNMLCVYPV